jgi:hypothetical protein
VSPSSFSPLLVPQRPPRRPAFRDPAPSIPPFRLVAEPLDDEAAALPGFAWAAAGAEVGRRHRLGGEPTHLAAADHPHCPDCGRAMTFYAQLDSLNDELVLADAGLLYVFVCFTCHTSTAFIHPA